MDDFNSIEANSKVPKKHYKMLSGAELYKFKPLRWMVRGVLPSQGLAALYGASGSGKSFLTLDLGFAIASENSEWFGRRVVHAPVTFVCLEGEAGMGKRVRAWEVYFKKPIPESLRFVTQPFDLLSSDVAELAKAINEVGGSNGLVIIDTLNRASVGADENSSVDMGKIIAASKKLQNLIGGLVLLVHHTGKDLGKGLRGHSSLYAALDGAIEVTKIGTRCEWSVAKSKDDLTGTAHPFCLEIVHMCEDSEGDEITSCIVKPEDSIKGANKRKFLPKSPQQKIIWDALQEVFKNSTKLGESASPSDKPCVTYEDAIDKTRVSLPIDKKRQTERTKAAITALVTQGFLEFKDGWLWIV